MGCSPFFRAHGTHHLLPLDIAESNYLLSPPAAVLSSMELIAHHAISLQKHLAQLAKLHYKVYNAQVKAAVWFEKKHSHTIRDFDFKLGDLVLIQNTAVEKALNRKMRPQYLGLLIIISQNQGGAYTIAKLDGSVFHYFIAAFQVILYLACSKITIPLLVELLDISQCCLQKLEESESADLDNKLDNRDNFLAND
jgi:hypothetical protein